MDIRKVNAEEIDQAVQLADHIFRESGHTSMGDAFPHIFSSGNKHNFGAFDGDRLVSFIGLVPNTIRIGQATLNVFSIGSVCTHDDYRGQGLASTLLQRVYHYIDQSGASLLFISGDRGLYSRNHCYHYGQSHHYTIKGEDRESTYKGTIRQGQETDLFQINQLRSKQPVRFESSLWEWATLLDASGYTSISKMKQTLFIAEHDGKVEGYLVMGIPEQTSSSTHGIVTECAGPSQIVLDMLHYVLEKYDMPAIDVSLPWHAPYREVLYDYQTEVTQGDSTIYLVDSERLLEQLKPYLNEKAPQLAQYLHITKQAEQMHTLSYNNTTKQYTTAELIELIFNVPKETKPTELETIFPVPLPDTEGMYYV